ncbi:hypothetical protein C8T65DRAFT_691743 [Cerioporus squamosus]|nr:hypothetical protein C8T65DRAFT_691743 [Cerioporus squamosus]
MPQFQGRMRIGYDTGEHIDIDVSSCDEETSGEDDGVQPTVVAAVVVEVAGAVVVEVVGVVLVRQDDNLRVIPSGPTYYLARINPGLLSSRFLASRTLDRRNCPLLLKSSLKPVLHIARPQRIPVLPLKLLMLLLPFPGLHVLPFTLMKDCILQTSHPRTCAGRRLSMTFCDLPPFPLMPHNRRSPLLRQNVVLVHFKMLERSMCTLAKPHLLVSIVKRRVCPPPDGWPAAPTGGWTGQHNPAAAFLSGPTISEALAMLRSANETILDLSQQLTVANQKLAYYEAEEATKKKGGSRTKRIAGNEDDPDQPAELSGKKLKLRSTIRAFALMHSPWPNLRPLEYTYTPNFDPLDPFERYANATTNEPRIEAQVVELRNFFPEEYLPFTTTAWMQRQFTEVINAYKSHIVSAVKDNAHIIFRHIPHLERDLDYWRGVAGDRYPAIFFPRDQKGNEEYLFQEASVAKACRIMTHGRTAGNADHRIRGNTNSSKWKLQSVTTAMLAIGLVLVRYLLSDFSSFERKNWQEAFYEYHRKILESMHKRSMQRLFAWLDLYVFGPGSDVPLAQTQEPNPIDDILLPGERNARLAPPAAPHLPQQADAHAHDHYLHQADRHDHPYNYSDNHGPLPLVPLHAHDNHADHPTGHEDVLHDNDDHTRGNGGVRNVHDDAHGACNTGGPRHIHQNEDIRDGWHLVGDGNNSGGNDGVYNSDGVNDNPRHDSRHADLHPPAHHELSYEDLRSSPPVSVGHDRGNVPISRHVHLPPGIGEHELPGDHVNAGAASAFASSSSHGASSGDTRTMLGGSVDEQAGKADPVVHLTTATADLALVQPKKTPRPRRKKTTATDSEQVPAQPSNPNLRLRSRKHA